MSRENKLLGSYIDASTRSNQLLELKRNISALVPEHVIEAELKETGRVNITMRKDEVICSTFVDSRRPGWYSLERAMEIAINLLQRWALGRYMKTYTGGRIGTR